jgi:hypothetical protein
MMARSTELSSTARTCGVAPTPPTPPAAAAAATAAAPPTLAISSSVPLTLRIAAREKSDRSAQDPCRRRRHRLTAQPWAGTARFIYTRGCGGFLPVTEGGTEAIGQEIPVRLCGE